MRIFLLLAVIVFSFPIQATELQLKKVLLSTGGVGHFEYEAEVLGNATLKLPIPLNQVDDVLKSITVYDNKGTVKSIELAGKQPLKQVFKGLPFKQSSFNSTSSLLNDLQGAYIKVSGVKKLQGKIIKVTEDETILDNIVTTKHRVSVLTKHGIQQFILEDAEKIEFDKELNSQINKALSEIENNKAQDARTIKINLIGNTKRKVRISYIAEVPLWKTTYRLVLAENKKDRLLQGWAVLENMSGKDWNDVELALISGNPVTFKQPLYTSYYVPRSEIPVSVGNRVLPKVDDGIIGEIYAKADKAYMPRKKSKMVKGRGRAKNITFLGGEASAYAPAPPAVANMAQVIKTEKTTASVTFKFPKKISVKAGHSLVVPIINDSLPMEKIALYQPQTHATHPLASVEITNTAKTALPQGILTIYELKNGMNYVGDAQLADFPEGEKRLLSFAVQNDISIDKKTVFNNLIVEGKINKGVFNLKRKQKETTIYNIKAPKEEQTLIIEQPRKYGWKVVEPKDVEITKNSYRINKKIKGEQKFSVVTERLLDEKIALISMHTSNIHHYIKNGKLSLNTKRLFRAIAEFKDKIYDYKIKISHLENNERGGIMQDQKRIRENMRGLSSSDKLRTRYLKKLNTQEDKMEEIDLEIDELIAKKQDMEKRLSDYIDNIE